MKPSFKRDLGLQLLALYLLFVGPVVLASLAFDRIAAQRLEADVKAADLSLARAIAQETNSIMDNALQAVRQLATYPEVIAADDGGMELFFHLLSNVRSDVNLIYRLDENGVMVYHYPLGPSSTVGWDFSYREYFQQAKTTNSPLVSLGRKSPTTQQLVTTAVMPIWREDGQFLGVVATNIKLQALSHTLASITAEHRAEDDFQIAIVDASGQVIAHPDPQVLLTDLSSPGGDVIQLVLAGQAGQPDPRRWERGGAPVQLRPGIDPGLGGDHQPPNGNRVCHAACHSPRCAADRGCVPGRRHFLLVCALQPGHPAFGAPGCFQPGDREKGAAAGRRPALFAAPDRALRPDWALDQQLDPDGAGDRSPFVRTGDAARNQHFRRLHLEFANRAQPHFGAGGALDGYPDVCHPGAG